MGGWSDYRPALALCKAPMTLVEWRHITLAGSELNGATTMTEEEWLSAVNPRPMLVQIRGQTSERKLRLFACGCCRRVWHLLGDVRNLRAVEIAEQFADGVVANQPLDDANETSYAVYANTSAPGTGFADSAEGISRATWEAAQAATVAATAYSIPNDAIYCAGAVAEQAAVAASFSAREEHAHVADYAADAAKTNERAEQALLLRCIVGSPFRSITLAAAWKTTNVVNLSQIAYDQRLLPTGLLETDRLAILADALEDAGCTDAPILEHLRGPGPHYRGCFVIDALLGKK
jgi:hypothetical protein